jgi:alpha-beta hydrolase superfamily lysophospholipase
MKIFGVERKVEIDPKVFPTEEEMSKVENTMPGCEHGWFDSVYEGAKLHYRRFVPPKPKAVVIFAHGISTHSGKSFVLKNGRKLNMALQAAELLKNDMALYAFDMYGHGFSEGTRFWIPETWENNKRDYVNFCNQVASQHPGVPLFLMGESYGCTLTIHVAKQFQEDPASGPAGFDSIMLVAPAIIGDLPPYPIYFILRYLLAPRYPKWVPFFMPNPISPERIWRDDEVLAIRTAPRYLEQGVDGSGLPFRLGTALNLVVALEEARNTAIPGFTVPYLILHGTEDHGVPIAGSEFMWEKAATPEADRSFLRKEGAYHDLLADFVAEECMQDMIDWIQKRIAAKEK